MTRILIVDDNSAIHVDFRNVLNPVEFNGRENALQLEKELFGSPQSLPAAALNKLFKLDSAFQGEEAIRKVEEAEQGGTPFALAFVDVRMPPGIDGVQTAIKLWEKSPDLQIVICSAYSDYSWEDIIAQMGHTDRLLIIPKPFESISVRQTALALTKKWELARRDKNRMNELEQMVASRTVELEKTVERLDILKTKAEQASAAKSSFLSIVSHEIRTPLNSINGMIELLLRTPLNENQQDFAQTIRYSADSLLAIVNDILDYSKLEARRITLEPAPFDIADTVESISELISMDAHKKGITVNTLIDPDVPLTVIGDHQRLRQILLNLAVNAVKFTNVGEIILQLKVLQQDTQQVKLKFEISDTGIGIDPQKKSILFKPFVQADVSTARRYGGTGLGLSICREICSLMNGEIDFESELEKGTTFWFTALLKQAREPEKEPDSNAVSLAGTAFFLAQKHETLRAAQWYCEKRNLTCFRANTRNELEELLNTHKESERLVFIDDSFPQEICTELRQKQIHSAYVTSREKTVIISNTSGVEILLKPIRRTPVTMLINRCFLAESKPQPVKQNASTGFPSHFKGKTVLIVDDNPMNIKVLRELLKIMGIICDEATSGFDAIELARQKSFDLILMDYFMPKMDGIQATAQIRQLGASNASVPIIALTGDASTDLHKFNQAHMDGVLLKPYTLEMLLQTLERIFKE